jgi:deoxyribodipyrimidine photo-lyase
LPTLVWFRGKDLRVADHEPLATAGRDAIPLFVLDPYFFTPERARTYAHRIQFLLDSLAELADSLQRLGSRLVVVEGRSVDVVPRIARELKVDRVVAHRWSEPFARERDRRVAEALDVPFDLFEGERLVPPGSIRTASGGTYQVFTPFWNAFVAQARIGEPIPTPTLAPAPRVADEVPIPTCDDLGIVRNPRLLEAGERAAQARLDAFRDDRYADDRDRLDVDGTSRLSQDLKFGTISVRTVWHATDSLGFRKELVWREFAHEMLWERPELLTEPFRSEWKDFPWEDDENHWNAWVEGRTGYPVVDAAARQLLAEGFVPNRARMIAASFLTKDLLVDFRRGEAHYARMLVDGDWAQNDFNWQWATGCGADAQPWFRIFNPTTQGEKFDPQGTYVRRWLPELEGVPDRLVHRPWAAGRPTPIVDHAEARRRFLTIAGAHMGRT